MSKLYPWRPYAKMSGRRSKTGRFCISSKHAKSTCKVFPSRSRPTQPNGGKSNFRSRVGISPFQQRLNFQEENKWMESFMKPLIRKLFTNTDFILFWFSIIRKKPRSRKKLTHFVIVRLFRCAIFSTWTFFWDKTCKKLFLSFQKKLLARL